MRVVRQRNRLPGEVVDAPTLKAQVGWDFEQPNLLENVPDHARGLDYMIFEGLFQPKPSCDSMFVWSPSVASVRLVR